MIFRAVFVRLVVGACLPWLVWWAWRTERTGLRIGRPLDDTFRERASRSGVRQPDRVRVVVPDEIPMPGTRWMHRLAARFGYDVTLTAGLCLRYAIFLRRDAEAIHDTILAHELVHTAQFERLGGLWPFLRQYLVECLRDGYRNSALEREAGHATGRPLSTRGRS